NSPIEIIFRDDLECGHLAPGLLRYVNQIRTSTDLSPSTKRQLTFPLTKFIMRGDNPRAPSNVGERMGPKVQTNGSSGYLLFGPWMALPRGRHEVQLFAVVLEAEGAYAEVVLFGGDDVLVRRPMERQLDSKKPASTLTFDLPTDVNNLEVR